jgi:hypothetical protein
MLGPALMQVQLRKLNSDGRTRSVHFRQRFKMPLAANDRVVALSHPTKRFREQDDGIRIVRIRRQPPLADEERVLVSRQFHKCMCRAEQRVGRRFAAFPDLPVLAERAVVVAGQEVQVGERERRVGIAGRFVDEPFEESLRIVVFADDRMPPCDGESVFTVVAELRSNGGEQFRRLAASPCIELHASQP